MISEKVTSFINKYDLYRNDKNDPNFMPASEIKAMQDEGLRNQIKLVLNFSPYYRELFKKHKIDGEKIKTTDDLVRLPLTYKKDYMERPEDFLLKFDKPGPQDAVWEITCTTGTTTGRPTPFYNTYHDYLGCLFQLRRMCKIAFMGPDDVHINLYPLPSVPHIGFLGAIRSCIAIGAAPISSCLGSPYAEFPVHNSSAKAMDMIEQHRGTHLWGLPSFLRRLIMEAENQGRDFSSVKLLFTSGEPCPRGMRKDMEDRLRSMGARDAWVSNALGFTEMQGCFVECEPFGGNHNPAPNIHFFEIVDPKTGERLLDGQKGLLVLTHINRRGTVLLRYVVGDLTAMTHEPCPYCGRTGDRLVITEGSAYAIRTQELMKFKGTLINPDILKDAIANIRGVDEYQIVFTKKDLNDPYSLDDLVVKIAVIGEQANEEITGEVVSKVLAAVEMRPRIVFCDRLEIYDPSVTMKAKRIVDERPAME